MAITVTDMVLCAMNGPIIGSLTEHISCELRFIKPLARATCIANLTTASHGWSLQKDRIIKHKLAHLKVIILVLDRTMLRLVLLNSRALHLR